MSIYDASNLLPVAPPVSAASPVSGGPLDLRGLTDWLTSPVEQTKKALADHAAEKVKEAAAEKAKEEADWQRTGEPWSKKADTLLTIAKWGVITIPLGIVAVSLMPIFRGTGAALHGIGAATEEGAASFRAARETVTRRNPGLPYGEKWQLVRRLGDRYWQIGNSHPNKSRDREFFIGVAEGIFEASELARTESVRTHIRRRATPKLRQYVRDRLVASKQGNLSLRHRSDGRHRGLLVAATFLADPKASFPVFG